MEERKKYFFEILYFFVLNIETFACILVTEFERLFRIMSIRYKGDFSFYKILFIILHNKFPVPTTHFQVF